MIEHKNYFRMFIQNIIATFAYSIIAITAIGWTIGDSVQEAGGLFVLGSEGMTYQCILQIFVCSIVIGSLRTLLLSDIIFKKVMLLWRSIILLLLSLISTGLFVVVFRWFPVGLVEAWVSFIISVIVCFIIAASVMVIKTKLADKKYSEFLSDYKARQNKESEE